MLKGLQIQPNRWSCLATAFAMACKIHVSELIRVIGHDGSEIIFPENPEPYNRRGFYPTEILFALLQFGFVASEFWSETELVAISSSKKANFDIGRIMNNYSCVVGGTINSHRHAAFWDHKLKFYYDPSGVIHKNSFDVEAMWIVSHLREI